MVLSLFLVSCGTSGRISESADNQDNGDSVTLEDVAIQAKFIDASKEKILGNFIQSEKHLMEILAQYPDHHASLFQLADIYHIQARYEESMTAIKKAIMLDPDNVWYHVLYADLLLKIDRFDLAAKEYEVIIEMIPNDKHYYNALAYSYLLDKDYKKTAETYDLIIKTFGFDESIILKKYRLLLSTGKEKQALEVLDELIAQYPYETIYKSEKAAYYTSKGKHRMAYELYQQILQQDPDNADVHLSLAYYYRDMGDNEQAFNELKLAFRNQNLDVDTKIKILLSYYDLTDNDPALKDQAYMLLDTLVMVHPNEAKAYSMLGDFYFRDRKYKQALDAFESVIQLDSTKFLVWDQLLTSAWCLKRFDKLGRYSRKAYDLFPSQSSVYLYRGIAEFYETNLDEALKTFKAGLYFAQFDADAKSRFYYWIAKTYGESKELSLSKSNYLLAVHKGNLATELLIDWKLYNVFNDKREYNPKIESRQDTILISKELFQFFNIIKEADWNNKSTIISLLQKAENDFQSDYQTLEYIGRIYEFLQKSDAAIRSYQSALKLSSGNKYIENRVTNLANGN